MKVTDILEQEIEPAENNCQGRLIGVGHQTFNLGDAGSSPVPDTKYIAG